MTTEQLSVLQRYVKAVSATAIERAFGRDPLYEVMEEDAAWEELCTVLSNPPVLQPCNPHK